MTSGSARPMGTFPTEEHAAILWQVPNYTVGWQRHVCVSGLRRDVLGSSVGESRTCDLSITSSKLYQLSWLYRATPLKLQGLELRLDSHTP